MKPVDVVSQGIPVGGGGASSSERPAPPSSSPKIASSEAAGRRPSPPATLGRRPETRPPLEARYRFDEAAGQMVVALTRPDTQEVVRQVPPEKIVRLIADLRDLVARRLEPRAGG